MSEDLIRRSDAIEAIELVDWYHQNRNKDIVSGANSREHQAWYKAEDIYKALEAVPSADRPQGKWIFKTIFPNDKREFPMGYLVCSGCGSHHSNSTPCNYCDNCGARMKGADDE